MCVWCVCSVCVCARACVYCVCVCARVRVCVCVIEIETAPMRYDSVPARVPCVYGHSLVHLMACAGIGSQAYRGMMFWSDGVMDGRALRRSCPHCACMPFSLQPPRRHHASPCCRAHM